MLYYRVNKNQEFELQQNYQMKYHVKLKNIHNKSDCKCKKIENYNRLKIMLKILV
jgi:hypothetical protein